MTPNAADATQRRTVARAARTGPMRPAIDSELTWLLHRAAQRLRTATGEQAETSGINLRDYIVLTALRTAPELTQIALGRMLGLDKTTLASQLDRLEGAGLVHRRADPHDRRARIPQITANGDAVCSTVATGSERIETAALRNHSAAEIRLLRRMLLDIIGETNDPGSCL